MGGGLGGVFVFWPKRREAGGGGGGGSLFRKIERGGGGGGEGPPPASQQALDMSAFFRTSTRYFGILYDFFSKVNFWTI